MCQVRLQVKYSLSGLDLSPNAVHLTSENPNGFAIVHAAGRNGHANDNSCPSGSSMWKYRSPHEAFCGFSGLNPSSLKRLQSASTSSTWKTSRPQPSTGLPCSRLRMAEFASFARREENPAVSPP